MKLKWVWMLVALAGLAGCEQAGDLQPKATPTVTGTATNSSASTTDASVTAVDASAAAANAAGPAATGPAGTSSTADEAAAGSTTIVLTPKNTKIEFVGAHVATDQPDRTGSFERFSGTATLADDGESLASVTVDIEADSLTTEFPKLTTHLNSEDFFDTRQHPTARFESTRIEAGDEGQVTITGDLTLMGNTKEVSFPATVEIGADGLKLDAEFTIDRTEFGMDKFTDQVKPTVSLTIAVDAATE